MTRLTPAVLAVGAAGKFAGLVLPELAKRGVKVRGLVQDAGQDARVRDHGAAEVAIGDLRDPASLGAALHGMHSVFYIAPAFMPDEADVGVRMVELAKRAGVRRFVFSSVIHPSLGALANHSAKAPVEEAILTSGMDYVILQPTMFFQNFARSWPAVAETGVLAEPWAIETRFTRVDYRDVAEVAAIALTENRLLSGTYELCAAGDLDRNDVARLMGEVLGRRIEAAKLQPDAAAQPPRTPAEAEQAAAMKRMTIWYDTHGLLGNPLVLRTILGREPRTLRAYVEELAAQPPAAR